MGQVARLRKGRGGRACPILEVQGAFKGEARTGVRLTAGWPQRPQPAVVIREPLPEDPHRPTMFAAADCRPGRRLPVKPDPKAL